MNIKEIPLLFEAVQKQHVFEDCKTFLDCTVKPHETFEVIYGQFLLYHKLQSFDLQAFVSIFFNMPTVFEPQMEPDSTRTIVQYIEQLWVHLMREADVANSSTLLPLPFPYIVPGGRFREIYYWDSYFTMLGLRESGEQNLIQNMIDNFAYLIDSQGYIPNGNRNYYLGRSQPPFFMLMICLRAGMYAKLPADEFPMDSTPFQIKRKFYAYIERYETQLEKEYAFWMNGAEVVTPENPSFKRVVRMPNGAILNRYWDENDTPRPESWREDVETAAKSAQKPSEVYRNLRAAAESGWDFSSRWLADSISLETIQTTDLIPIDLNCLLFFMEKMLFQMYAFHEDEVKMLFYHGRMVRRIQTIHQFFWNSEQNFYFDYHWKQQKMSKCCTLAGAFPMFFHMAKLEEAAAMAQVIENQFLKSGGLVTTFSHTGQQWDAPNGWAPLQWIAFKGLQAYRQNDVANKIRQRWMLTCEKAYQKFGKMKEKYNVCEDIVATGGEYPNQEGFGWTNGVYRAMHSTL
jgi:alpha,alpha-trehalase